MPERARGSRRPGGLLTWSVAIVAGGMAAAAVAALFRGSVSRVPARAAARPAPAEPAAVTAGTAADAGGPMAAGGAGGGGAPAPTLQLVSVGGAGGDPALSEDVALFDPATLFLPTRWNSSHVVKAISEPGDAFGGFPPDLVFPESAPALDLPREPLPTSPGAALSDDPPGVPLLGFGREPERIVPLAARGGFLEVLDAATGRPVWAEALPEAAPPADAPWQPMEFLAAVDAAGLVGPLIATVSSGARPVDSYFRRYLAETVRVGARLAPGFYRISVGP